MVAVGLSTHGLGTKVPPAVLLFLRRFRPTLEEGIDDARKLFEELKEAGVDYAVVTFEGTARAGYMSDPGQVFVKSLRSPYPRARVLRVDSSRAERSIKARFPAVPVEYAPVERLARVCRATPQELVDPGVTGELTGHTVPRHHPVEPPTARFWSPLRGGPMSWMTASVCAGEPWMCDQSSNVVTPASMAPSAESRSPMYASSGRKAGASLCRTNEM